MRPADARGVSRSTAPHRQGSAAKCVPNEMARGQKANNSLPQQVKFVTQSIKRRQARQNQPTGEKESPTNRKPVQSTVFVMHYNCKICRRFLLSEARVELRFDWFHFDAPATALDGRSICCICGEHIRGQQREWGREVKRQTKFTCFGPH